MRLELQRSWTVTTKETPRKTTSPRSKRREADAERDKAQMDAPNGEMDT